MKLGTSFSGSFLKTLFKQRGDAKRQMLRAIMMSKPRGNPASEISEINVAGAVD